MKLSSLTIAVAIGSLLVMNMSAADSAPKSAPEMKKFSVFVGHWKLQETDEASPFGPAGTATFDSHGKYILNGFFYEEHGTGKVGDQPLEYTSISYYDSGAHVYRNFYYDSNGTTISASGRFEGDTFRAEGVQEMNGKKYQTKSESVPAADGKTFTYRMDFSEDGTNWKLVYKGTAVRTGGK